MKRRSRVIALFMAIILTATAMELPSRAVDVDIIGDKNPARPEQPVVVEATDRIEFYGVEANTDNIRIQAWGTGASFQLVLEIMTDGGVRLYDSAACNSLFQDRIEKLKDTIIAEPGIDSMTATGKISGTRVEIEFAKAHEWSLKIYKKDSKDLAYILNAENLGVTYGSGYTREGVSLQGEIAPNEQFIGLGERYTGTILNGKSYPLWNEDGWSAGLNGNKTTSYANVPLLHSNQGYSLFFNSFYSANADIGSENNPHEYRLDFDGPDLDLFVWTGTPLENVKSYMAVTGTTAVIPKWATGYWAGGNSGNYWENIAKKYYDKDTGKASTAKTSDYYDEAIREVLQNYKNMGTLPSAIFGESMPTRSLDTVSAVSSEFGVELLGWYHPDQPWDADQYRMINKNVLTSLRGFTSTDSLPFIKTTSGEYYTYTNDDGKSEWNRVDYTHANAGKLVTANLKRGWNKDLSGLMVDYGEYINANWVFANGMTGKEMHNLQAYYYNSVMKNAWENSSKAGDYILFARAGSAGSQSFAAQFGGDQKCNFEGLRQAVMGGLSASASGFGIWGSDIGGLGIGDAVSENNPLLTAELYMRWLGFGTFSTLMRSHGTMDHDPWTFEEEVKAEGLDVDVKKVFQKYYWTRENLSDAIYSATLQSNKDGTPVMQVMGLSYPEHFSVGDQYLFCNEMLVAPIYEKGNNAIKGSVTKSITLPEGNWYDLWSGKRIVGDGTAIILDVTVDDTPVYLRSGSVMPVDLSAKTFDLADSMENGNSLQALFVTPAEEGESRTSTWYIGEDEHAPAFTYTSQTTGGVYTIQAKQTASNPKVLRGYGIDASSVYVDGTLVPRLYHKPIGTETGCYVNEGTGEMVLVLADGNWEQITFNHTIQESHEKIEFDSINVDSLSEKGFTSTQLDKNVASAEPFALVGEADQAVSTHWFSGKLATTSSGTTLKSSHNGLKPLTTDADKKVQLLNTPYSFKNFKISTEVYWGVNTGVVLGERNVYPRNTSNYNSIIVYFANNRIQLGGALDYSTAKVIGKKNGWTTSGTTGIFYFADSFTAVKNQVYTLNVEMQNNVLTVWVDGYPGVLTISVAKHYKTGAIALVGHKSDAGGNDGGGIKSFAIEKRNDGYVNLDHIRVADLEAAGFTSTQFDRDNNYAIVGEADQAVSKHWFSGTSTTTSGGKILNSGNTGTKPMMKESDKKAQLLNTPYVYENFKIRAEVYWGVNTGVVFGKRNVYPRNTSDYSSISVYFANNRVQLGGALDYSTAKVTGKENGWTTYGTTGIFYFTDSFTAVKNAIYTLNVEMQNGILTVWVDGYPGVLTVEAADHYETGAIALVGHKYDGDGGGIKSFLVDEIRTRYKEYTSTEFATYREGSEFTAPAYDGYLFAGWFYDELGREPVQSKTRTTERTVYAKFVPENVLTVKAQISSNLLDDNTRDDGSGSIRFVTTVDTLRYKKAGFQISYDKGDGRGVQNPKLYSNTVYTRLYAVIGDATGGSIEYDPTEFGQTSTYFKACTVRNIDASLYDMELTVTPFWITLDGTEVRGETEVRTVRQGMGLEVNRK